MTGAMRGAAVADMSRVRQLLVYHIGFMRVCSSSSTEFIVGPSTEVDNPDYVWNLNLDEPEPVQCRAPEIKL